MAEIPFLANLTYPVALLALSLLVPIILLYLLKPKPKTIPFPSTMFIRFLEKNKRFTSFLQRFIRDPLLIAQLLIITLLVSALAGPFYNTKEELRPEESVVFVIDASASMQAKDVGQPRFDQAVEKASQIIRGLNEADDVSIVLAENIPAVVLSKSKPKDSLNTLSQLKAADTPSNVGDAMMLAKDLIRDSDRRKAVYVLSDFSPGGGVDPQLALKIMAAAGVNAELVTTGSRGANTGIVNLEARRSTVKDSELFMTMSVRNFAPEEHRFRLQVASEGSTLVSEEKTLGAGEEGFYNYKPNITGSEQVVRVEIAGGDDLTVDDVAYAYVPPVKINRVLLLTSEGSDKFLRLMLDSLKNTEVKYAVPPVTPDVNDFDVIVLGNVKPDTILPGMFRDIKNHVEKGASFIIVGTPNLQSIKDQELWSILPVDVIGMGSRETSLKVIEEHNMLSDIKLNGIVAKNYYNVVERDNKTKTLVGAEVFQNPMIAYHQQGDGYVAYVGVNSDPDWSNLYYSSDFPIFWSQMIKYFTRMRGPSAATALKSGEYLQLPEPSNVKTPSGATIRSQSVFLDKVGLYEVGYSDKIEKVTVNLLDFMESNTTIGQVEGAKNAGTYTVKKLDVDVKVELFRHLLVVMLAVLVFELLIYRWRGLL